MVLDIAIVTGLIVLLMFFSGAETALTAVSKPMMHQLEVEGNQRAQLVNRLQNRKERLLGSILLGNTLAQILASAMATRVAISAFGDAGVAYGTAIMTVVVLVFCEILPKTMALHRANQMALLFAPVVRVITFAFSPIIQAVQLFVNGLLRLCGVSLAASTDLEASLAELRGAIDIHVADEENRSERNMLRSILELDEVEVGEIMIHRKNLISIDGDQPLGAILEQVAERPYTRMPVWRGEPDNIVGVLHIKALLLALRERLGEAEPAIDVVALSSPPWFIPESTTLLDQLQQFRKRREHFALVVDEYGALQGAVTLEDIIEEIVGDIADEHEVQSQRARPQPDGSVVVAGDVSIRDLNREFEWRLPDEDAATIAGLVLHESRSIPSIGQTFLFHGFRFEVLKRVRNQITSLKIYPPLEQGTDGH